MREDFRKSANLSTFITLITGSGSCNLSLWHPKLIYPISMDSLTKVVNLDQNMQYLGYVASD